MAITGNPYEDVERYLAGIKFPCSKADLVNFAISNGAPSSVLDTLNRMPDLTYSSMSAVFTCVGEVE